jgi:hypothetical protein
MELQQRQQAVQQNQIALRDQQARTDALNSWDKKDINDLPGLILKHGGSGDAAFGMQNQLIEQKKNYALADEATKKNMESSNDIIAGHLEAIKGADDKPVAYQNMVGDLMQKGLVKPGRLPDQYPGDDKLDLLEKGFIGQKQLFDQAQKERETAAKESEAQAKATSAGNVEKRLEAEMPGGALRPQGLQEQDDWLKKNPGKGPADFMRYKATLVPAYNFNVAAGGVAPSVNDPLVQAVAGNKMKIGDVLTPRTPLPIRKQFLANVLQVNPSFDSRDYDIEKGVQREFTTGSAAKNLTAFNTAIEHAGQLRNAADALDNNDVRGLNKIGNILGYQFGSDKTTNFNVIKNALSGEISKVFKGGQATDAEIKEVQAPFDAANSPAQLRGAIDSAVKLMNSKRDALKQQYEAGRKGQPNFGGGAVAKTITRASMEKAAKDHNVSVDVIEKQARDEGYEVKP